MTDVLTLLSEANPVRVEDLAALDPPDLAQRRLPSRRLLLAIAVVTAAAAASLIGAFAFGSSPRHLEPIRRSLVPSPTLERPLPPPFAKQISLADARATLGAPIVLPDTSVVGPSDAGPVWLQDELPHFADVAVTFPGPKLIVYYLRPTQYPEAPLAMYGDEAKSQPGTSVVDLQGVPGLATEQNSDQTGTNFGSVEFVVDGTQIDVLGHYDEATLQSVAQSIVDQESAPSLTLGLGSPPTIDHPLPFAGKQASLSVAAAAFGAPIVQPETSLVSPSGAGPVWMLSRFDLNVVAVTYPGADVWVTYSWPASYDGGYGDQLLRYHARNAMTHTALLDGVPAQVVFHSWKQRRWSGFYPSVHFAAGSVQVAVWGRQDEPTLEAIARSIVDRSERPPAGQLGDVAGVQVYPYLRHARQISLSDASRTLGSSVVLPESPLAPTDGAQAWAEGTCPHPGAVPHTTELCAVWISFGSGLSVGYIRPPAYLGTGKEWRLQARGLGSGGSAVRLHGVPALSIHRNSRAGYPGRVELDLGGTRVVVAGDYSPARLQEVARSIVARSW